ncbi:SDR family oxidoreductase [Bacillus sp. FJAT-42376]|uniref:SDR family oxidoreductase n=1 Tax=Bacillus sp. FJAT-42376 TaxID=2014076 RepID=UPI000F4F362B|nr:SDR family oxidoreductase [Bacillus sp. FJAT-42376]AZB42599.1 SDR family oxidoreductase [Bacillus sp. FJAT-42376]
MDLNLQHKTALVIASSQGLGKAVAKKLAQEGANVVITGRDAEKLEILQQELAYIGDGRIISKVCDITDLEQIKELVRHTVEEFGEIDVLVNNAGGPPAGTFEEISDDQWYKAFELNLLSYVRVIREVLPFMKEKGGRIVNIASSSVKEPIAGLLLSNTFRMGIVGLTKTLSQEYAPQNILINTLAPGRIATDRVAFLDETSAKNNGITAEEMAEKNKSLIPLGRYGEPEEFANYAVFLLSGANTYVTGQTLLVDGGMVKSV